MIPYRKEEREPLEKKSSEESAFPTSHYYTHLHQLVPRTSYLLLFALHTLVFDYRHLDLIPILAVEYTSYTHLREDHTTRPTRLFACSHSSRQSQTPNTQCQKRSKPPNRPLKPPNPPLQNQFRTPPPSSPPPSFTTPMSALSSPS